MDEKPFPHDIAPSVRDNPPPFDAMDVEMIIKFCPQVWRMPINPICMDADYRRVPERVSETERNSMLYIAAGS
jgi:hypothetical protein